MLLVNIDWWLVDNNWIDILSLNLKARFPDLGWSNYLFLQENEVFGLLYQQKSVCCLKEFPKVFLHWNWWSFYFSSLFWGKGCWYRSQSDEISQCLVPYDFHETICVKSWIPVQDTLSAYVIGIHFKINSKISFKSILKCSGPKMVSRGTPVITSFQLFKEQFIVLFRNLLHR